MILYWHLPSESSPLFLVKRGLGMGEVNIASWALLSQALEQFFWIL